MTTRDEVQEGCLLPGLRARGIGHSYNHRPRRSARRSASTSSRSKNWNCCGAMEVKNIDPKIQTYLSSRVMSIAANEMDMDVVMAPCNGCYHNLKKAEYDLANDEDSVEVVDRLSKKAGHKTYESGQVETIHALDWIKDAIGEDGLKARVKNSLSGIKVANYYGCMYTRPRHIFPEKDQGPGSESTSKPHFMDDLLAAAGAENVDFPLKTACCGGAHTLSDSDTSTKLVLNILKAAKMSGADVIATECPTCHIRVSRCTRSAPRRRSVRRSTSRSSTSRSCSGWRSASSRARSACTRTSPTRWHSSRKRAWHEDACRIEARSIGSPRLDSRRRCRGARNCSAQRRGPRALDHGARRVRPTRSARDSACSRCTGRARRAIRASMPAARPAASSPITTIW